MLPAGYLLKDTYVVDGLHARGGMALVYRVHHRELGVTRALKVLQPQFAEDADFVQRFRREAQIMASLRHPNIAEVYDCGTTTEGWLYLIMEWLEGEDLAASVKRGARLPLEMVASLSKQISAALAVAHAAGVTHRDLKPGNILLCRSAQGELAKVVDFGIARLRTEGTPQTLPGIVMGTPGYMSPEQLLGRVDKIDARSDQFALAVILYELLLGSRLFGSAGASRDALRVLGLRISQLALPPLPLENRALGRRLEHVLRRAMASTPAQRFPSIAVFDEAFQAAVADGTLTPSISVELLPSRAQGQPPVGRRVQRWLSAAGILLAGAVSLAVLVQLTPRSWRRPATKAALLRASADSLLNSSPRPALIRIIPLVGTVKSAVCTRATNTQITVSDDHKLTAADVHAAQTLIKQCLRATKIVLGPRAKEILLERTSYLHVMGGLDIPDKGLLEHCLRTRFTHRPPRRVLISHKITEASLCHAP